MSSYRCIFFDLDHTLWDYERNSRETLQELYTAHKLHQKGISEFALFHNRFREVNTYLWELYDTGKIDSQVIRKERFRNILQPFYVMDETLSETLSTQYLNECPRKGHLLPGALETLEYLVNKNYRLTVITNGFEETQKLKLAAGNLHGFFDHVITSQKAQCRKPAKEIFQFAMDVNNIQCHEALMIGDNLITDIGGARNASVDHVFFNPDRVAHNEKVTYEIHTLSELQQFL